MKEGIREHHFGVLIMFLMQVIQSATKHTAIVVFSVTGFRIVMIQFMKSMRRYKNLNIAYGERMPITEGKKQVRLNF